MTNKLFIIFFTIFLFSLVNAQLDVTKDNINVNGINIIPPLPPPFDNNTGNVNSSDFWDDLDTLYTTLSTNSPSKRLYIRI